MGTMLYKSIERGDANMHFAQIRKMDISNGEGCGVSLFTQGCP